MRVSISILGLMSALVAAAPTATGGGATIYKQQNLAVSPLGTDSTSIPANAYCTDLNNIFGDFDGKVRSLSVEKGVKCQFYLNTGCPTDGTKKEVGSKDKKVEEKTLAKEWDGKIRSVFCQKI
ncbi:hypothetical protein P153DRAFT_387370 [Dothidotthia symphoricarpi CBS 119687]|uniref:Uncharacterized protein n=1 Tax=Dothidotthia symphoricarpi CBS 119687 TaxID=1392245 RepID=A0A6A6AAC4_9PLEO|nr:uncharacterized protein P153DRAFT_387370 [Dothidotthia symphoricarpi CBS 119687]KAF2127631.1 hypothetical protein P153DRAFT_387370 [Dothidotthia symphoricarpi CBS 119687]